uniref:Uncharacterized protein n=1 Tax=uncultured organism TaxID=155900 RepID=M1PPR8_9ZZZZ|nr:hypothetical protein FLSS-17_0018 [uncultured organism]
MDREDLPQQIKNGGIACLSTSSRRRQNKLKKLLEISDAGNLSASLWEAVDFFIENNE